MKEQKQRRQMSNTSGAGVSAFISALEPVPVPFGVKLDSAEEEELWQAFTRARAKEDWRDMDLILVAKIVKIEANITRYQKTLDEQGAVITNPKGTPIVNPLFSIVDTLTRQMLAVIRSMSLNSVGDARIVANHAKVHDSARRIGKAADEQDLLA